VVEENKKKFSLKRMNLRKRNGELIPLGKG